MKLTNGQKEAIARKAMEIVNAKKEAKREELRAKYKPSDRAKDLISRLKSLFAARKEYMDRVADLGFRIEYSYIQEGKDDFVEFQIGHCNRNITLENILDKIHDKELGDKFNAVFKYPCDQDILDDLELLSLGKAFDVDAFLDKYKNL